MKKRLRNAIAILGIVAMFFTAAMPAHAAELEGEQQQTAQTEATEKFEYTVVTDKAGLLTEEQIQNIEAKTSELQNYAVALYVENSDPKTCNQRYANTLSETMYTEVFGDYRNGVMIVFSFYKAENCYYAIHYGGNVNLTESKVSRIIEGTYHDYKTDATWVEGSFCQCVDYFKEAEAIPADTQSTGDNESTPMPTSTKVFLILFIVTAIIAVILLYNYLVLRSEKKYVDGELREANNENSDVRTRNSELSDKLSTANDECDELRTWKKYAITVRPMIQDEIDDWVARRDAEGFDKKYSSVIKLEPIMENFVHLDAMVGAYEKMSNLAKSYVSLNMEIASKKRQEAGEAYAKAATEKIQNVCDHCTGSRHERHELNDTMSYYNGLPMFVRLMIAQSLVNRLSSAKDNADSAQRRYTSSQSSYSSSSHHGGTFGGSFHSGGTFGGHCGGGH